MIKKIFTLLNDWRKLPAYQLERRADIYFAAHLEIIFKEILSEDILDIIPEFPIRIGSIYPEIDINKSYKVDYAVFTKTSKIYLVELKTDDGSTRPEQYRYYYASIEKGADVILNGLSKIFDATDAKEKYKNLMDKLILLDAISIEAKNGFSSTSKFDFFPEPVFIKPNKLDMDAGKVIDFNTIVSILSKEEDEITQEFVKALEKWKIPV